MENSQDTKPDVANLGPEFSIIQWIHQRSRANTQNEALDLGIGDDAAILKACDRRLVVTKDVLTEGTHFVLKGTPLSHIGHKALAVNLSDMAAMAAEPTCAFIGVVLPKHFQRWQVEELYEGIFKLAQSYDVSISGGDTNVWDGPLVMSVTLLGAEHVAGSVLRSGARVGDQIFVTGALGGSLASGRHLTFQPRVREARQLRDQFHLHAMLDLSDGLASDLRHILQASGVGAILESGQIPIHSDVDQELSADARLQHALCDGEDFELLFTLSPEEAVRLLTNTELDFPITRIGEIKVEPSFFLFDGTEPIPFEKTGWVHQ